MPARPGGPPFAVAAIEQQHRVVGLEPQHIAQVMRLLLAGSDRRAGRETLLDIEREGFGNRIGSPRVPDELRRAFGWAALPSRPIGARARAAHRCVITLILPAAQMSNFGGGSGYDMAESARSPRTMTLFRAMALVSALILAGLSEAAAQFPPRPVRTRRRRSPARFRRRPASRSSQSSPFPPPPGPGSSSSPVRFPPPGQSSAVPRHRRARSRRVGRGRVLRRLVRNRHPCACNSSDPRAGRKGRRRHQNRQRPQGHARRNLRAVHQIRGFGRQDGEVPGDQSEASAVCRRMRSSKSEANTPRSLQIRKQVCSRGPGRRRAPSLSDALGGPVLADEKPKPGRGTFDTLDRQSAGAMI